jgi:hypothetical protein
MLAQKMKLTTLFQKPLAVALLRLHLTEEDESRRIRRERCRVGTSPDKGRKAGLCIDFPFSRIQLDDRYSGPERPSDTENGRFIVTSSGDTRIRSAGGAWCGVGMSQLPVSLKFCAC